MLPTEDQSKPLPGQRKKQYRVLIADDEKATRILLTHFLKKMGYEPVDAVDGEACIEILEKEDIDLLLLDISMPKKDGFAVMSYLQEKGRTMPVIMVTASHDIPQTVKCIKMGAYEYLTKPLDVDRLQIVLRNAITESELQDKVSQLKKELKSKEIFRNIIGSTPAIRLAMEHAMQVMETELNVLILGESGTGKELFAQAIHEGSRRKNGPFVTINCAAITNELSDSLLFGHVKGSFTGANSDHTGFFEQADGGTIFLDEIGDMNLEIQAKVLRVLQEKKIRRVGEKKERAVDFRVISATHRDFSHAIHNNSFRDDLYYRLEEYPLYVPPLRDRREDIPLIARHFLEEFCSANNLELLTLTENAEEEMMEHDWPGNVRELKNAIQRTAISSKHTGEINSFILPGARSMHTAGKNASDGKLSPRNSSPRPSAKSGKIQSLDEIERLAIEEAYEACKRNPTKTAEALGIGRATLYRKLKKFGLN